MIKQSIFLVIQLFQIFIYFYTFHISSTLNITNKTTHRPDDGSAELKRYSADWLCFSINTPFLFGLRVVNFSSQIVGLLSIIFLYIYIYIYAYILFQASKNHSFKKKIKFRFKNLPETLVICRATVAFAFRSSTDCSFFVRCCFQDVCKTSYSIFE